MSLTNKSEVKWTKQCKSSYDIEYFGFLLSKVIDTGDVILLRGNLGAGKTTFARGFIRSKYNDNKMIITSPSYLLDNTYEYEDLSIHIGKIKSIHHMDLYRLPTGCDLSMFDIPGMSLFI
jgi:tRNA threonylcarbamoyl adenosine modification protein YjeE